MANSKRKCPCCGKYNRPPEEGVVVRDRLYCSYDHATEYAIRIKPKGKAIIEKEYRKEVKKKKEAQLTRSDWLKKASKAVNAYVRERDNGKKCVTCDKLLLKTGRVGGDYDAGHYRDKAQAKNLELHALNIHGQCKKCNNQAWGGHSKVVYREEIVKRIGEDMVAKIDADNEPRKYPIPDLQRIESIFKEKLKRLRRKNK